MSAPRSAAGRSYRSGQVGAGLVAGTAVLFATCAFVGGGWFVIQWVALAVVTFMIATIVCLQRLIRSAEANYTPPARPAIQARNVNRPLAGVPASAQRAIRAQPVNATRKGR